MRYNNLQAGRILAAGTVLATHTVYYGHTLLGLSPFAIGPVADYCVRTSIVFLFALSGFILAHSLQAAGLREFVQFRLLRLFPAYWAAAVVVLAVRWANGGPLPPSWRQFGSGLVLWPVGPNRAYYLLGIEWTLIYELFLSMALVPLAALGRGWCGLGGGAALWLGLCVAKQAVFPDSSVTQFPRPAQLPLSLANVPFLTGVVVYFAHRHWAGWRPWVLLAAALAFTGGAAFAETAGNWSVVLQSLGAALVVGGCAVGPQLDAKNTLVVAGDWSYGVYLLHVPVLTGFFTLAARHGWFPATDATVVFAGVLALTAGSAFGALEWAHYRYLRRVLVKKPRAAVPAPSPAPPVNRAA